MAEPRYLHVTSSTLFVPWGMLYTHPVPDEKLRGDGSNWRKEGFWGFNHIIQQTPERADLETRIRPVNDEVPLSINFDTRIADALGLPAIDQHFDFISKRAGRTCCVRRTTKIQIQEAFTTTRDQLERILYFYCHGRGSTDGRCVNLRETQLIMTDESISAYDLQDWGGDTKLPTAPLLFINACQGGQMTTMFYKTLANEMLRQGAVGLVGAQIDIPALFATVYARCIFRKFLSRRVLPVRLGPLLRYANQLFWKKGNNPLGLQPS